MTEKPPKPTPNSGTQDGDHETGIRERRWVKARLLSAGFDSTEAEAMAAAYLAHLSPSPVSGTEPDTTNGEEVCHRCGGPNRPWAAPSPLWNAVMRDGSINGRDEFDGIVCPTCFVVLAEERGIACGWWVEADTVTAELEMVTSSGRVWDPYARRWADVGTPKAEAGETT